MMSAKFRLRRLGSMPSISAVKDLLEIKSDITIIGRNKFVADLFLDSKNTVGLISRMHARIIRTEKDDNEQYELCDTSLNGTYVNDYKVAGSVLLKDGDLVTFGHIKGAVIDPGAFAPQKNSEFLFKFERIQENNSFDAKDSTPLHSYKNTSKNSWQLNFQTPTNAELHSLVNSVVSKNNEFDSDEELTFNATAVRQGQNEDEDFKTTAQFDTLSDKLSTKVRRASDESHVKLTGAAKRKQNLQNKNLKRP